MTIEELEQWQEAFEQFHARFADLFERSESREQARKYLRGLLANASRKNSWQLAEVVGEQWCGAVGKLDNCQVATVLSYATKQAHVFLDRELYLPEEWAWNKQRRAEARVPEAVRFETKPEQALAMLERAWAQGVPMRWVTGDEVYGDSPRLRETIQAHGRFYVLAVSATTRVWTERPEVQEPEEDTGGRPRRAPRLASGAPLALMSPGAPE